MSNDLISARLGNYRIQRLLGRGGFAEVYLAEHIFLKTPAAIKLLHTSQQGTQDFLQEARLLASLKHPHIVSILEFDLYEDRPFLVMEYMPYGTLRQRYPRGSRLPIETVLASIQQIAAALHYLHGRGLAHGDVKPENMLLGAEARLHLSDFGIAILANKEQEQALVGTIEYMAPEQLQHQLQPASDQYALGITAYEWLAGTPPFTGSYIEVATQHALVDPLPLREHIPHLPAEIDAVILRALAKEPEQRFASIGDFAKELENAYDGTLATVRRDPTPATQTMPTAPFLPPIQHTVPASATPHSRRSLLIAGATGAALLGLAGTSGFFWWKTTQQSANAVTSAPSPRSTQPDHQQPKSRQGNTYYIYQHQSAPISALAWSPDGKRIASASSLTANTPGNSTSTEHSIHVWDALTGSHPVIYQGHQNAISRVAWSPDGKYIASSGAGNPSLHVWEASTGKRIAVFTHESATVNQIYWQGNSQILFAATDVGRIFLWKPFTPTDWIRVFDKRALVDESEGCGVSPNGKYILTFFKEVYRLSDLKLLSMDEGNSGGGVDNYNNWAPNSQYLVTASFEYAPYVWNPLNGKTIATFTRDFQIETLGWSLDCKHIASFGLAGAVFIWSASDGHEQYAYFPHARSATSLAWSPNGQMIASGDIQGSVEVWQAM